MNEKGELVKGLDPEDRSMRVSASIRRFELMGKLQLRLGGCHIRSLDHFILYLSKAPFAVSMSSNVHVEEKKKSI